MDHAVALDPPSRSVARWMSWHLDVPAAATWLSAFSTVLYLAMRDGGYDTIVRSDVGVAIWWAVLVGVIAGILPARIGRSAWIAIGLLGGFAIWTGIAASWSENTESSVVELGRLAAYLGVLVLAVALQGRGGVRQTINGLACAVGLVSALAVLSRLHPQAFPPDAHFQFLNPGSARKLSYPINYWNGLAAFAALGIPLNLAIAVGGRTLAGRALAAAALPVSALCIYLTVSRGGVLEAVVGLAVFLLVVPKRVHALAALLVGGAGSAILLSATSRHAAVSAGVPSPAETLQGTHLFWLCVVVCLGVGSINVAFSLTAQRLPRPALLRPSRGRAAQIAAVLCAALVAVALAAGAPARVSRAWHQFKQAGSAAPAPSQATVFTRLQDANGNGRYQLWQAAWHAAESHPWTGIGPGTFQFWWSRHATTDGFVRNAHSLYLETLAETGIIGAALLCGLMLWFAAAAVLKLARGSVEQRLWTAAAAGGLATFLVAAAIEWVWQLAALAAAALMLGATIVAAPARGDAAEGPAPRSRPLQRPLLALMSVVALGATIVPLAGAVAIRESQDAAARGQLGAAYADSLAAQRLQPYAESARLQEALVLEAAGDLARAAAAAQAATARGPTDWTAWLTLARIQARRGARAAALAALREAQHLNPRSALFVQP